MHGVALGPRLASSSRRAEQNERKRERPAERRRKDDEPRTPGAPLRANGDGWKPATHVGGHVDGGRLFTFHLFDARREVRRDVDDDAIARARLVRRFDRLRHDVFPTVRGEVRAIRLGPEHRVRRPNPRRRHVLEDVLQTPWPRRIRRRSRKRVRRRRRERPFHARPTRPRRRDRV